MRKGKDAATWIGAAGAVTVTCGSFSIGARPDLAGLAPATRWWWLVSGSGQLAGLVLVWLGVVVLVGAWLSQLVRARSAMLSAARARRQFWAWTLPLLPALPVFSGDAWSYLAQGEMLGGPLNPYIDGPGNAGGAFVAFVHPDWRFTPAPYGPLQLWLLHGIAALTAETPWLGVVLLRAVTLGALALALAALPRIASRIGTDPGFAIWLGLANPLVVVHLVGGIHNDALALAFVVPALAIALAAAESGPSRGHHAALVCGAGTLLGLALAVKVTAVIALPFVAWLGARRLLPAVWNAFLLTSSAALTVVALSLASGSGFGWFDALSVSDRVVNWLSLPTAVSHLLAAVGVGTFEDLLVVARRGAMALLAALLVVMWAAAWPRRREVGTGSQRRVLACLAAAWTALFVLNSVTWPWYWVFVLALVAVLKPRLPLLALCCGGVVFQLLATGPNGSTSLYTPGFAAAAVVAGIVVGVVILKMPSLGRGA